MARSKGARRRRGAGAGSRRWLERQARDRYVRRAREEGYRSRAAYKLLELDRRHRLLRPGMTVVDLGAAPGGWSQVAARRAGPRGRVVALDLLPMEPVPGVTFIQGDFREEGPLQALLEAVGGGRAVDLVLSDMAPNLSGLRAVDQPRAMHLAELALDLARQVLRPGGALLVKAFQGEGLDAYRDELRSCFRKVIHAKPEASRAASRELYLLALNYVL